VCSTGGVSSGVTELAWGLILALTKHILTEDRSLRSGSWQTALAGNIRGRTLGLLGLGNLGTAMLPGARAFGMDVIAWSENLTPEAAGEHGVACVGFDELFERSHVLSIHTRLSTRTTGLVGAAQFARMPTGAVLVNTSRGPIVDEGALIAALSSGQIAGAGLDVFDVEPLPHDHPLTRFDQVVLTPHLGYASEDNIARMYSDAIEDIAGFLVGSPIRVLSAGWR
jgi:phosphoglycerate dehydrogenase-like enzyme